MTHKMSMVDRLRRTTMLILFIKEREALP